MKPSFYPGRIYRVAAVRFDVSTGQTMATVADDTGVCWEVPAGAGETLREGWGVEMVNGYAVLRAACEQPKSTRPRAEVKQVRHDPFPDHPEPPPAPVPMSGRAVAGWWLVAAGVLITLAGFLLDGRAPGTDIVNLARQNMKMMLVIAGMGTGICGVLLVK